MFDFLLLHWWRSCADLWVVFCWLCGHRQRIAKTTRQSNCEEKKNAKTYREKEKSDKKNERKRELKCVFGICTAKKNLFLSLTLSLSFLHSFSVFFCVVVFPLHRVLCSLSLSSSFLCGCPCGGCFLFLSLSLSRATGFVSHLLRLGSAGVFLQSLMDVNDLQKSPQQPSLSLLSLRFTRHSRYGNPSERS